MLSGTPAPSTASFISRLKHIANADVPHLDNGQPSAIAPITPAASSSSDSTATTTTHQLQQVIFTDQSAMPDDMASSCDGVVVVQPPQHVQMANGGGGGRSAALERAYVHDVYENCDEPVGSVRPKVAQFLAGLDPGSMVCDVGCGSGRYLNACNPLIFTMGVDRCDRLANVTKEKGGEVALCDNLELPFRDESFDAVLSVAVVHHFATTERRVGAIRELARIMRIGGRVIITVWALEQKQRRFESQDVLIPWQQPKSRNSNFSDEEDDEDYLPPYHAYTEDSTNSSRSAGDGDSSSLSSSSPGESCYSFVRRAIQKLAGNGVKRHPWFLDTWNSKDTKNGSSLDYEDAKDLPIELRRLEDFDDFPEPPLSASLKSRSLGSILYPPPSRQIVRSRSSVPSLGGAHIPENVIVQCSSSQNYSTSSNATPSSANTATMLGLSHSAASGESSRRPRLVKQKQSLCDDDFVVATTPTHAMYSTDGAPIGCPSTKDTRPLLRKQSSLNEELMAENRIREREKVKKRIQKQMSLNEAYLTRSAVFSRRLQVIRDGLTTKLKSSTGSLERVTKNGLVKIMQNIKSSTGGGHCSTDGGAEAKTSASTSAPANAANPGSSSVGPMNTVTQLSEEEQKERRHSRESGSDSSKDSLQSDTSIESEDSFASVIFIPKPDQQKQQSPHNAHPNNNEAAFVSTRTPSVPTSPLVMPCPTPAHSPAPPRCKVQQQMLMHETTRFPFENLHLQKSDPETALRSVACKPPSNETSLRSATRPLNRPAQQRAANIVISPPTPVPTKVERITKQVVKNLPQIPKFRKHFSINYPIVRRTSTAPSVPKLSSMEIFNPETDDLDSDSSEPSSPDSIDSVISAFKPPPTTVSTTGDSNSSTEQCTTTDTGVTKSPLDDNSTLTTILNGVDNLKRDSLIDDDQPPYSLLDNEDDSGSKVPPNGENGVNHQDLVAFAEKLSAQLLKEMDKNHSSSSTDDTSALLPTDQDDENSYEPSDEPNSEPLLAEPRFRFEDPYIKKLNGELKDLHSLREELRERRLMLANLNIQHYQSSSTIHEEDESPRADGDEDSSRTQQEENSAHNTSHSSVRQRPTGVHRMASVDAEPFPDDIASILNSNDNLHVADPQSLTHQQRSTSSASSRHGGAGQATAFKGGSSSDEVSAQQPPQIESRPSVESWAHSNSTASLDSPSAGGSSTHHRYYHVFREGELDALINHHVASLHIVSSYYERASWCVVAEKVQVWTI